jgi:hypothetical protein
MTLDEAIAIAKNVYEDESADARGRKDYRQIAEWLEELKQYKLASPYKKPAYKLTKFEKDLLQSCTGKYMFKYIPVLCRMKEKGYFKGIDENATIEDILANCEITEEE